MVSYLMAWKQILIPEGHGWGERCCMSVPAVTKSSQQLLRKGDDFVHSAHGGVVARGL